MRKPLAKGSYDLLSLIQAKPADAYGAGLYAQLATLRGHEPAFGAIYTMLDRLVEDGLVTSKWGEKTAERGGRRKRLYTITAKGQQALRDTEAAYQPLAQRGTIDGGMPGILGGLPMKGGA